MYLKNKFHNFQIVFIIIFFIKCDSHKKFEIIENFNISLRYDPIQIDNISENDFFLLDSIKIIHQKKSTTSTNKYKLILPTPVYTIDKIEKKEFSNKTNSIDLAIRIYEHLKLHKKYQISNPKSIFSVGLINIKRNDGEKIIVKKKHLYPLLINN